MPGIAQPFTDSPDDYQQSLAQLPLPQSARTAAVFDAGRDFGREALHYLPYAGFGLIRPPGVTGEDFAVQQDPQTLNQEYGTDGLRFNEPDSRYEAAFKQNMARRKALRDFTLSRTSPQPLTDIGASLAGALTDPVGLPFMFAGGEAAEGLFGLGKAAEGAAAATTTLGRIANAARAPLEGAVGQVPYVGTAYAMAQASGDDYDAGDALRDIAAGAILHTSAHALFRALPGLWRRGGIDPDAPAADAPGTAPENAMQPNPAPPGGVPPAVDALPETARTGAFAHAVESTLGDEPVDVGRHVERELSPDSLAALDERDAQPSIPSLRPLPDDHPLAGDQIAVTTRGTQVPVRYGLAELADLTTSNDDALEPNPDYPPELQPRAPDRAGAMARNYQLEGELNPKLLIGDVGAGVGAPIVAPDGVVESGNGRTIALRRSAARGTPAYDRYVAELKAQDLPVDGMERPALVRVRSAPLTGAQRSALVHEMNADVVERMSASEQAMADARAMTPADLARLDGTPNGPREFARGFLARVAPDQIGALVDGQGRLSQAGQARLDAALVARAYGDPRLVETLFEATDSNIKAVGAALKDAAPAWAAMRAAVARGEIPSALDLTDNLRSAVDLLRTARDAAGDTGRFLLERLEQGEMFAGTEVSPQTEALLRLFFRDEAFRRPLAASKIAEALQWYAARAGEYKPGPDLFGDVDHADIARQLTDRLRQRFADDAAGRDAGFEFAAVRPAQPPGGTGGEPEPPLVDVRSLGGQGDGARPSLSPQGGAGPEGAGAAAGRGSSGAEPLSQADLEARLEAWKQGQPFGSVAEAYEGAPEAQSLLGKIGTAIAEETGAVWHDPGLKAREGAAAKIVRKGYESAKALTDIVRGAFEARTPELADRIAEALSEHYEILDEGWRTNGAGYADRKLILRSDDGRLAEVQILDPAMQAAKDREGHSLYEIERASRPGSPVAQRAREKMRALYASARSEGFAEADVGGESGAYRAKRARQAASDITAPVWKTSRSSTAVQGAEGESLANASEPTSTAGRLSQFTNVIEKSPLDNNDTTRSAAQGGAAQLLDDPDIKALADDTDRLAAALGVEPEAPPNRDPATLAEAMRAAAVCLIGELA